jgi:large repetitive protein
MTVAVSFSIVSGAVPPGALYYQIDCGPPTPVGQITCIVGSGPHVLTFCKPGNSANVYQITSIASPSVPNSLIAPIACNSTLLALGLEESTVTWNDITSGTGQYNSFLSCVNGCDTVIVTPTLPAPAYVDYEVCGDVQAKDCYVSISFCDTVRVYFADSLYAWVENDSLGYCEDQGGVWLHGHASGGVPPYTYYWTDGPWGTGNIVSYDTNYYATATGIYSFVVEDTRHPICPREILNVDVFEAPDPVLTVTPNNPNYCLGSAVTFYLSGADYYQWSPSTGLSSTTNDTVIADPPATTTYTIIGTSIYGCTDTITTTYVAVPLPVVDAGTGDSICIGASAQLQGSGGLQYSWSPAGSLDNPLIANPVATPTSTTTYTMTAWSPSGQVIPNGDFSSGNTAFSSAYGYNSNLWVEGQYYVTNDPNLTHPNFSACTDHTGGSGNMMVVNGAGTPNVNVWCQSIPVIPNTDYVFSTWLASVHPSSPAILQFSINGVLLGAPFGATSTTCQWSQFYATWNSGANTFANICIVNQNTALTGNDFALDDINFSPLCQNTDTVTIFVSDPQISLAAQHPLCSGGSDGSVTSAVTNGVPAYDYLWSTGSTATGISSLPDGTYSLTITDALGCVTSDSIMLSAPPLLTATISASTNVSCFGGNNGSATVTAAGGVAPYTYNWSNGTTTASNNNLIAGTYTVTVTDDHACTATTSVTITEPTLLTAAISASTNVSCFGGNDGSASVTAAGGVAPYTYNWSNGTTTATNNNLIAGTYTVTVTDDHGCTATTSVTITEPTLLTATISASTNVSCFGGNDGSATFTAAGGVAPYTYNWSNGTTTATNNNLIAGTYTVTVTDDHSCTATTTVTITEPTLLTATISASTNVSCFGGNNGSATVTAAGGVAPYTYNWSNGTTTATNNNLIAGTYTVTVTDDHGCTATTSVTITEPTLLTATISASTNVSCFGGNDGSATVTAAGGMAPYTYNWSNGTTTASNNNLIAGTYTVTVTDDHSCTATTTVTITEPTLLTATISASTNVSCFGGNNGSATVTAAGGVAPYTYNWSNGTATASNNNLIAGTYTVTVTDDHGCTATASVSITEPTLLTATISASANVLCFSGNDGSATVTAAGGVAPYTYNWSNGTTTASNNNLIAGTYTVTVTDDHGCTATASVTITEPTLLTANISASANVLCFSGNDGSATVTAAGGVAPYTYNWSNGTATASNNNLIAGTYTVTVTDDHGCTATTSVTITEPTLLTATISASTNVSCFGGNNGSATVTAAGGVAPYTYNWSNGTTTATNNNLISGTYTVTVTDDHGCTATASVSITEPTLLTATISASANVLCFSGNDGSATVTAAGGVAPYTYNWSNGTATASNNNLIAGTYTVTVTDDHGCTATASVTITEPTLLTATISASANVLCFSGNDGSATVTAAGGVALYTYNWSNGTTTASNNNLIAGTYTVTVTDDHGCTATASVTITEPTLLTATISASANVLCFAGNNGSATVTAAGGVAPYTYNWSNGTTTATKQQPDCRYLYSNCYR